MVCIEMEVALQRLIAEGLSGWDHQYANLVIETTSSVLIQKPPPFISLRRAKKEWVGARKGNFENVRLSAMHPNAHAEEMAMLNPELHTVSLNGATFACPTFVFAHDAVIKCTNGVCDNVPLPELRSRVLCCRCTEHCGDIVWLLATSSELYLRVGAKWTSRLWSPWATQASAIDLVSNGNKLHVVYAERNSLVLCDCTWATKHVWSNEFHPCSVAAADGKVYSCVCTSQVIRICTRTYAEDIFSLDVFEWCKNQPATLVCASTDAVAVGFGDGSVAWFTPDFSTMTSRYVHPSHAVCVKALQLWGEFHATCEYRHRQKLIEQNMLCTQIKMENARIVEHMLGYCTLSPRMLRIALNMAVKLGHYTISKNLIESGASATWETVLTALSMPIFMLNMPFFTMLVDASDGLGTLGFTPGLITLANTRPKLFRDIVYKLMSHNCPVRATFLATLCVYSSPSSGMIKDLQAHGACINVHDNEGAFRRGTTAIEHAASRLDIGLMTRLLEHGAKPSTEDELVEVLSQLYKTHDPFRWLLKMEKHNVDLDMLQGWTPEYDEHLKRVHLHRERWSHRTHKLLAQPIKDAVFTTLLCVRRKKLLPAELWRYIFSFLDISSAAWADLAIRRTRI